MSATLLLGFALQRHACSLLLHIGTRQPASLAEAQVLIMLPHVRYTVLRLNRGCCFWCCLTGSACPLLESVLGRLQLGCSPSPASAGRASTPAWQHKAALQAPHRKLYLLLRHVSCRWLTWLPTTAKMQPITDCAYKTSNSLLLTGVTLPIATVRKHGPTACRIIS
jgi:hypothetical protein